MNKIEVKVLHQSSDSPGGIMSFLARLTQRGHKVSNMAELEKLYNMSLCRPPIAGLVDLPHGTIKRFTPITVAIVGASRRFLGQIRTHQVGVNYMSASLQYSDYSNINPDESFVVPFHMLQPNFSDIKDDYLASCKNQLDVYSSLINKGIPHDEAAYAMPQGLRNVLLINANHEAWMNIISKRTCNRNTLETQYVMLRVAEALMNNSYDGDIMFEKAGPPCAYGSCMEGYMSCKYPLKGMTPAEIIKHKFPLLY